MQIWGVDLGVRSFTAACIDSYTGYLRLEHFKSPTPKMVRDQPAHERARELRYAGIALAHRVVGGDQVYIELPPLAGSRNIQTFSKLSMMAGVLASACNVHTEFVAVDVWKRAIIGKGGVDKARVSEVLAEISKSYSRQCGDDQNSVDATCIALYGLARATSTGGLDQPQREDLEVRR